MGSTEAYGNLLFDIGIKNEFLFLVLVVRMREIRQRFVAFDFHVYVAVA